MQRDIEQLPGCVRLTPTEIARLQADQKIKQDFPIVNQEFSALQEMLEMTHGDANKETTGKMMAGVMQDFLPALKKVAELGSSNNKPYGKYDRGSWLLVKNPKVHYLDAFWRHQLDGMYNIDPTTGQIHLVAMAWNLLALLTFHLRDEGPKNG